MPDIANQKTIESIRKLGDANSPNQWRIKDQAGAEYGPYTWEQIVNFAGEGRLLNSYEVIHPAKTRGQWISINRVKQLSDAVLAYENTEKPKEFIQTIDTSNVSVPPKSAEPVHPFFEKLSSPQFKKSYRSQILSRSVDGFDEFLFAFIDPTFKYYVTPTVVVITWCVFLVLSALTLILSTLALFEFKLLGAYRNAIHDPAKAPTPFEPNNGFGLTELLGSDVTRWAIMTVATLIGILWIRVVLESVIVVFHASEALRSIDRKTS